MTDLMSPAAQTVCNALTHLLRGYAKEAGLAPDLADSLILAWDGETFVATSHLSLEDAEYGDGKRPAPRPIHKAMNRLEADAELMLSGLVQDAYATVPVRY